MHVCVYVCMHNKKNIFLKEAFGCVSIVEVGMAGEKPAVQY